MTGYTVHTGSSIKFSDGWDKIFTKDTKKKTTTKTGAKKVTAKKKSNGRKRGGR